MRVAIYNQMFGLDGRSFLGNVYGHYLAHFQKNTGKVLRRTNVSETVKIVQQSDADVVGICEVYEGQESVLAKQLKAIGYPYMYCGKGHMFKYSSKRVMEVIVSRTEGVQRHYPMWPVENKLGGGGGFVVVKFKDLDMHIMLVHMATPYRLYFKNQIQHMKKIIQELPGKVIVMGDFNHTYTQVRRHLAGFDLISGKDKTCSTTPIMKWFYHKDIDHIFGKGLRRKALGLMDGRSDHKLIWVDLEKIGE